MLGLSKPLSELYLCGKYPPPQTDWIGHLRHLSHKALRPAWYIRTKCDRYTSSMWEVRTLKPVLVNPSPQILRTSTGSILPSLSMTMIPLRPPPMASVDDTGPAPKIRSRTFSKVRMRNVGSSSENQASNRRISQSA